MSIGGKKKSTTINYSLLLSDTPSNEETYQAKTTGLMNLIGTNPSYTIIFTTNGYILITCYIPDTMKSTLHIFSLNLQNNRCDKFY